MGKTKEMVMDFHDNSDEYINEQIQLKMSTDHQYYINLYEQDIDRELDDGNKN
jgi:hypothetical protein